MKYSNTAKQRIRMDTYDSGSYLIGYDWILMVAAAMLAGIMVTTTYRTTDPEIVDIAVYQMVSGIAGMIIGLFVLLKKPPVPDSNATIGSIRIGMPNKDDTMNMLYYFMGGFVVVELFTYITAGGLLSQSIFTPNFNIAVTAAVMEEALFGLALTSLFGNVFYYLFGKMFGNAGYRGYSTQLKGPFLIFAQIVTCAMVGMFFVMLHVGVYGTTNEMLLLQIFWARFVYSFAFLRTRNITVPTAMHLLHNITAALAMG